MKSVDSIRLALLFFPRAFRRRQGEDMLETYEDLIAQTEPALRPRAKRQAFLQLARAGLAERFAFLTSSVAFIAGAFGAFSPVSPPPGFRPPRSTFMDDFVQDLKSAYRSLRRRPGFALMVMATLAVGLGASAAMFGVVHGVLLEPLPYENSDRLVSIHRVFTNDPDRRADNMSIPDLHDVGQEISGLAAATGVNADRETLIVDGEPQFMQTASLTHGVLRVFDVAPHLGRDLTAQDAVVGAPLVVLVGHDFWATHLGADRDVLGKTLELSSATYEIVGVAPPGFDYPQKAQVWTALQVNTETDCGRGCHIISGLGLLSEDVDLSVVNQELEGLGAALEEEFPGSNIHKRFAARRLLEQEVEPVRGGLWMLLGAVQLVVLIAAANVANLMLVRGSRRRREMAIRSAVGAGRARLFRLLMLENTFLAVGGAALGWLLGLGVLRAFLALAPADLPRLEAIALDGPVLLFTATLTLVVLMLFGLVPAWRSAAIDLRSRSQAGTTHGRRSRQILLTAEVALALILLLGSGLLLRSFAAMTEVDLGYQTDRLARVTFLLPDGSYPEPEQAVAFSQELEERLRSTPGVEAAGLYFAGPFGTVRVTSSIRPLDRPEPQPGEKLGASFDSVSPGFFSTLGLEPVRGRFFTDADTRQAPLSLVVSQSLAERYFPGKDPIGERVKISMGLGFDNDDAIFTIIGVAPNIRAYSITDEPAPAVYMAQSQTGAQFLTALVRTKAGADVVPAVREHIQALDPSLAIHATGTQEAAVDEELGPHRFYLGLLMAFAAIALFLSAIGLYAVIAYLVSQRTRELAVRMALGADSGSVLRLVLLDALRPALLGIGFGWLGALGGARLLEGLLYGITPHDTLTYVLAPTVLLAVAMLATLAPAFRASRLEPRVALEQE